MAPFPGRGTRRSSTWRPHTGKPWAGKPGTRPWLLLLPVHYNAGLELPDRTVAARFLTGRAEQVGKLAPTLGPSALYGSVDPGARRPWMLPRKQGGWFWS